MSKAGHAPTLPLEVDLPALAGLDWRALGGQLDESGSP